MTIFIQSPVSLCSGNADALDVRSREWLPDRPLVEEYKACAKSGPGRLCIEKLRKNQHFRLVGPGNAPATA
jgi:hypothetical protein